MYAGKRAFQYITLSNLGQVLFTWHEFCVLAFLVARLLHACACPLVSWWVGSCWWDAHQSNAVDDTCLCAGACSAAVTTDGQLLTWGQDAAAQPGGPGIPRPLSGLGEHVIVQARPMQHRQLRPTHAL